LLLWVLLAKVALLLLDPNLRLFMGDSASYLHAALTDWDPPDRSVVYPELVAWSAVNAHSAHALVLLQSLMGAACCLLAFWMLRRAAGLPAWLAAAVAMLIAVEPTQLFYERMLMAESAGLLALMSTVATTLAYVQSGHRRWIPLIALFGILTVSFRMSLLPVIFGLATIVPLLRAWHVLADGKPEQRRQRTILRSALDGLLIAVAVVGMHQVYQAAYGERMDAAPGYMVAEGRMRLGLLAPLIRPEHFEAVGLPQDFAAGLGLELGDHRNREGQIWAPNGLWMRLETALGEPRAYEVAGELASLALRSDPLGLPRMSLLTLRDYFNDEVAIWRLHDDFGTRQPDAGTLDSMADALRYDADEFTANPGLIGRAFLSSRWWLTAWLFGLAPLALVCLLLNLRDPRRRAAALTLGFTALGLVASHMLFSHIVSFRYLHPLPVFGFMTAALVFEPKLRWQVRRTLQTA
jgi:hypothetical protein